MATSTDEILVRLGFDGSAVSRGTEAMLSQQQKAADTYVGFWESALAKQAALESKANDASLAKLKANMEAKAALTKEFFTAQAAQYEIAQGSIPMNMRGAAANAEGSAARRMEGDLEAGAAGAIGGGVARAGVFRETAVLIREFFRRNWSRMIGSVSLLAQYAGITAATIATSIPIIGTGAVAIYSAFRQRAALKEMSGAYGTNETGHKQAVEINKELEKQITLLVKRGQLTKEQAQDMDKFLAGGHFGVVQARLRKLFPEGLEDALSKKVTTPEEAMRQADERIKREQDELDKLNDKKRNEVTLQKQIEQKQEDIKYQTAYLNALDQKSLEAHQAKADLLQMQLDLTKDLTQQQEEQAKETAKWKEWSDRAARDYMKGTIQSAMEEREFPTIEALAGRGFVNRLNRGYGRGGQFDLESGNGSFGGIARDYLWAQKQQMWDLTYGNPKAAEQDRLRMIADRTKLVAAGVASPEQIMGKIGDDTGRLRALFDALVSSNAISTTIVANQN